MSVLTKATWRNIPEDDILHSHRRENLKSYIAKQFLFHVISVCSKALIMSNLGVYHVFTTDIELIYVVVLATESSAETGE
jgi:hypothetical protein